MIISQDKDPYQPTSILECHKGLFSRCSKNRPCDGNPTSKDSRFLCFCVHPIWRGVFLSFFSAEFRWFFFIKKSRYHCLADSQVVRVKDPSVCFFRKHLGAGFVNILHVHPYLRFIDFSGGLKQTTNT